MELEKHPQIAERDQVSIRPSRLEDLLSIVEVEKSAFGQGYSFSNIRQYYDLFGDLLYVAETSHAKIVGYVLGGVTTRDNQVGWVLSIGLKQDYQEKGIGKQLMNTIQLQLHARSCRKILLTVPPAKDHTVRFYEKMGYTKQALWPDYFGANVPRYVMQLLLP